MDINQIVIQLYTLVTSGEWGAAIALAVYGAAVYSNNNLPSWLKNSTRFVKTTVTVVVAAILAGAQSFMSLHELMDAVNNVGTASVVTLAAAGLNRIKGKDDDINNPPDGNIINS